MTTRPPIVAVLLTGLGVPLGLLVAMLAPMVLFVVVDRSYGQAPREARFLVPLAGLLLWVWLRRPVPSSVPAMNREVST